MIVDLSMSSQKLINSGLHSGSDDTLRRAEAILQWFLDSMPHTLSHTNAHGFSVFLTLFRVIAKATGHSWHGAWEEAGMPSEASVHVGEVGYPFQSLLRSLRWGMAFEPWAVYSAFALGASSTGSNVSSVAYLSAPEPCNLECALALAAYADLIRLANPKGVRSSRFQRSLAAIQNCLAAVTDHHGFLLPLLAARSTIGLSLLLALDRLECRSVARVNTLNEENVASQVFGHSHLFGSEAAAKAASATITESSPRGRSLKISVLPWRDFESSYIRGWTKLHCGDDVRALVRRRMPADSGLFVDVGAYMGSCSFWAAAYDDSVKVLAVEPFGAAVSAMRTSIRWNNLEGRVRVIHACVGEKHHSMRRKILRPVEDRRTFYHVQQPRWEQLASQNEVTDGEVVGCDRLDAMLANRRVAVLRVLVGDGVLPVLATAEGLARRGLLGSVIIGYPSLAAARLLWRWGMSVEVGNVPIPAWDEHVLNATMFGPHVRSHLSLLAIASGADSESKSDKGALERRRGSK
eukprot:gnl/TRDRNA2_/TRDRNA2_159826_c0_seq2.p1 gnl/TRDRNA2_/TRDRNA2_159826_c0~~gnl/TRDRNA2_/TRDRNA2_159826_c0_seq2.p1  ORF type:complete len:545 (+),score=63.27 gnl/TRDRNA2_/TRDRNA2_159826_c0_seq2:77-1636(+)